MFKNRMPALALLAAAAFVLAGKRTRGRKAAE